MNSNPSLFSFREHFTNISRIVLIFFLKLKVTYEVLTFNKKQLVINL